MYHLIVYSFLCFRLNMVVLHVKKGDESQFLYETTVEIKVEQLVSELVPIFNGRLKVNRVCGGAFLLI